MKTKSTFLELCKAFLRAKPHAWCEWNENASTRHKKINIHKVLWWSGTAACRIRGHSSRPLWEKRNSFFSSGNALEKRYVFANRFPWKTVRVRVRLRVNERRGSTHSIEYASHATELLLRKMRMQSGHHLLRHWEAGKGKEEEEAAAQPWLVQG